jgi:hypothetical protein
MSLVARKSTLLLDVSISLVARGLFLPSADNISLDCRQISLAESLFRISFFFLADPCCWVSSFSHLVVGLLQLFCLRYHTRLSVSCL